MDCVTEDCEPCLIEQMDKENQGHECTEMCEIDGENRRNSQDWHRQSHEPITCDDCGNTIAVTSYMDRTGLYHTTCPRGCCTIWRCKNCDSDWGGWGPVACPYCNPNGARWRPTRVKRLHRQYALRRNGAHR